MGSIACENTCGMFRHVDMNTPISYHTCHDDCSSEIISKVLYCLVGTTLCLLYTTLLSRWPTYIQAKLPCMCMSVTFCHVYECLYSHCCIARTIIARKQCSSVQGYIHENIYLGMRASKEYCLGIVRKHATEEEGNRKERSFFVSLLACNGTSMYLGNQTCQTWCDIVYYRSYGISRSHTNPNGSDFDSMTSRCRHYIVLQPSYIRLTTIQQVEI